MNNNKAWIQDHESVIQLSFYVCLAMYCIATLKLYIILNYDLKHHTLFLKRFPWNANEKKRKCQNVGRITFYDTHHSFPSIIHSYLWRVESVSDTLSEDGVKSPAWFSWSFQYERNCETFSFFFCSLFASCCFRAIHYFKEN